MNESIDDIALWARKELQQAKQATAEWRKDARTCYDFMPCRQWSEEESKILEEDDRVPVTFNRFARTINAIKGLEIQNRQAVKYLPREIMDSGFNEMLTDAAKWARDNCDAEDEESESFEDMVICGMGWTDTHLSYDSEEDGEVVVEREDPLCMFWDANARKKNISDARWVAKAIRMSKEDIKEQWPDYEFGEMKGEDLIDDDSDLPHDASPPHYDGESVDHKSKKVFEVVKFQYFTKEPYARVGSGQRILKFHGDRFEKLRGYVESHNLPYVKQFRKRYWCLYLCGQDILEHKELEIQDGFTLKAMTGMRDRNRNTWFGLGLLMLDPQRWANKWLSQIIHILNTNAKGGLLAEEGAFVNPRKAEMDWAKPDAVTWLKQGGLQKIQQKAAAQYPAGFDRLLQYAIEAISDTPGVNMEIMGLAGRQQAGVLESMRKQAGVTMLAFLFDAMRRYRKEQGRVLAAFIRDYISDGRLIRVVGDQGAQYVPLIRDRVAFKYDVVVDEAPTSHNMKEKVFAVMAEMLPMLMKAGIMPPPDVLDYSPLPEALVQKWKAQLTAPKEPPPPDPKAEALFEAELHDKHATANKKDAETALTQAKTEQTQVDMGMQMLQPFIDSQNPVPEDQIVA